MWYGHVRRTSASRWILIGMDWSSMARKRRGRSRKSERNEVDEVMGTRNVKD